MEGVFSALPRSLDMNSPLDPHPQYPQHVQRATYLLWSIVAYKVRINLLGFCDNLSGGPGFLEVLAGQPELHVLLTELRLQERPESCQAL